MNLYLITLPITIVTSFGLGLFIYLKNRRSMVNKMWFMTSITVALWSLCMRLTLFSTNYNFALTFARAGNVAAMYLPIFFTHFALAITGRYGRKNKILLCGYVLALFISFFGFSRYFMPTVKPFLGFNYFGRPGVHYFLYTILFWFFVCYSQFTLIQGYKKSDPLKRNQLKYIIIGTSLAFLGGGTFFLGIYGIEFDPWPAHFTPIYTILMAYAILKYKLMDITVVIRKGLIYSVLISIVTAIYIFLVYLTEKLFRGLIGYKSVSWSLSVLGFIILISIPLRNKVQYFLDRCFFKGTLETLAEQKEKLFEEVKRSQQLRAVGAMAAGFAHEAKNPLTTIKTFIGYLEEQHNQKEFREKFKHLVGSEIDKIDNLTNQILDFAKPKPLVLEEVDIYQIIDDILDFLDENFITHNVTVTKQYHNDIQTIQTDRVRLGQVFLNLFLNAIDAMPKGGSLTVKTHLDNNSISIHVIDTGTGIPQEDLPKLFNPFYTKKTSGAGLGLAISKSITEELGGAISVTSQKDVGTTFTVKLPAQIKGI